MDFNKKRNREFFNKNLLFRTVGVVFLITIVILVVADFKIYNKKKELAAQINNYKKQIEDIKKSSQTLKDEIVNSDSKDYLEKLAYEQLGQQKPGEQEIIFVNPQEKPKTAATSENFWDIKSWTSWLSQSWNWLKSKF
jgi:cell division protein FtsB